MRKDTFTTSEAAAELGVTPARVRQMVLDGLLPAEKFGRDLVITADALEIAKQRKTARGPEPKAKAEGSKASKKGGGKK
jgi:excisionase family DNA binding protein